MLLSCWFQNLPIKIDSRRWACPFCIKVMEREAWMKRHIMIHFGDKPFKCQFCTYSGAQKVQLNLHLKKCHAKLYSWKCINAITIKYSKLVKWQISINFRLSQSDLEVGNMNVLFALELWKVQQISKDISELTLEKNHFNATFVILLQDWSVLWKST